MMDFKFINELFSLGYIIKIYTVIALSILSGAHMTIFSKVVELLKNENINDILITGGGIIPDKDMETLSKMGVGKLFGPGTPVDDSLQYIVSWFNEHKQ